MRRWILSEDGRVFEVKEDQVLVEYKGLPPKNPIFVVPETELREAKMLIRQMKEALFQATEDVSNAKRRLDHALERFK